MDIRKEILEKVFIRTENRTDINWLFDFRKVSLSPFFLQMYTEKFFEIFKHEKDIQICGMESAAIPLVAAIVLESRKKNLNFNGFFIRKSAKKHDLFNIIEGQVNSSPVIIVDDLINSGSSILKQIKILKERNIQVKKVFTILRFRDIDFYDFIKNENIELISLFELNDFTPELGLKNLIPKKEESLKPIQHKTLWAKKYGADTIIFRKNVVPKSSPILYNGKLYFGTDSGNFCCVDATNGNIIWEAKVWFGTSGKLIFSTPCVAHDTVFFGAYDGNFYAYDSNTGKRKWVYSDADWIGSSPCVSNKLNLVYIGLEYGLINKKGGVVAIDISTGREVWKDFHRGLTHCSPYISGNNKLVFCGSNDGMLRIYDATSGNLLKLHNIGHEIKSSFSENSTGDKVSFGAFDGNCYIINTKSLEIESTLKSFEAIYTTPVWVKDKVIFASLDKRVYCYDANNRNLIWETTAKGRIFSSPTIFKNHLWIGCNDGKIRKINLQTGLEQGYIQFTDRIVDKVLFTEQENLIVKTFANEIHCIKLFTNEDSNLSEH